MGDQGKSQELEALEQTLTQSNPGGAKKAGASSAKKKKKSKISSGDGVLWTTRLEIFLKSGWSQFREILRGLFSPEWQVRRMSWLFVLSLIGVAAVLTLTVQRKKALDALNPEQPEVAAHSEGSLQENFGHMVGKSADFAKRKFSTMELGSFNVELKRDPALKLPRGVINMAEIELVAECDSKVTCEYIETHMTRARDQVSTLLTALERDELMSKSGKRKLKKTLLDRLNHWLPSGKLENLYVTKLVIS